MACRAAVGRRQEGRSRAPGGGGRDPPEGPVLHTRSVWQRPGGRPGPSHREGSRRTAQPPPGEEQSSEATALYSKLYLTSVSASIDKIRIADVLLDSAGPGPSRPTPARAPTCGCRGRARGALRSHLLFGGGGGAVRKCWPRAAGSPRSAPAEAGRGGGTARGGGRPAGTPPGWRTKEHTSACSRRAAEEGLQGRRRRRGAEAHVLPRQPRSMSTTPVTTPVIVVQKSR